MTSQTCLSESARGSFDPTAPLTVPKTESSWYAVRVRSRFEFVVSRAFRQKGFEELLPSYKCTHKWSDRLKHVETPLFPGYIFCRFDGAHLYHLLNTVGVMHIVSVAGKPVPVEESEIVTIRKLCRSGLRVEPWPHLQVGQQLTIKRGPLAGAVGEVLELKNTFRIVATISLLQRSVIAEIDRSWISVAD